MKEQNVLSFNRRHICVSPSHKRPWKRLNVDATLRSCIAFTFSSCNKQKNVHLDDMSDFISNTLKTFFSFRTCLPQGPSMSPHAQMNTLKPSVWLKHLQEKKQSAVFDSLNGFNYRVNIDKKINCNRNLKAKINEMDWLHNDYTPLYELTPMESVVRPSTRKGSFPYRTKLLHCNSEPQASSSEHQFNADHNGWDITLHGLLFQRKTVLTAERIKVNCWDHIESLFNFV